MSLLPFMFNYAGQHLVDDNNIVVFSYVYDSWGKLLSTGGTLSSTVGVQNPFLYKGYYFDFETSLYYCHSRYYNPMWRRWLNADSVDNLDAKSPNGFNLFAYCGNNPIMYTDPSGQFALISFVIGLGIATLIGSLVGAVSYVASEAISYVLTDEWSWSWGSFIGSTLGGSITGAITFAIPSLSIPVAAGINGFLSTALGMGCIRNIFARTLERIKFQKDSQYILLV